MSSSSAKVPEALAKRLCRFAFVDAIRGEPDFWRTQEIRKSEFTVGPNGKLMGEFSMSTADGKRGLEGTFEAEIKAAAGKVIGFKGYAEATAWGSGTYTPGAPIGQFPMKFAFVIAPKTKDSVAPQAAMFGNEYLRP
jgi:hypothetical protein